MPRLPGISQKDAVRVFQKLGYRIVRESGHLILSNGERRSRPGECSGIKQPLGVVLQGAPIGAAQQGAPIGATPETSRFSLGSAETEQIGLW
ncbi:type II toxin-antitoxin system HicA family toxin [Cyanobium usitatum]|jgi:hypothetical protein|uniref:Addiction module toxin, HicA family n=1 Tax=Cyanobium usitatum str. Tous TaxID=2116684 RepID=A0A2P7MXS5_9CYAN|nr:type II toxin-antitoxin system HicA family toxin [Cyanobium usitatum]MCP9780228.1 hypothetical protein [Cyanobium sp. To12R1]PSJ05977.1 hypothetical protein C7K55_05985 [Cyanobium usitatum str. Tous]